jgi:hypothetical protein
VGARLSVAIAAAALAAVAARSTPARAADDNPDALIRRGVELRRQGKDQEALEQFRKAYAQANSPRAAAQIGLAEQALGRWADAESHLEQALAAAGDPWIRKNAPVLKSAVEAIQKHLGSLDIIGPAGAEARVNGQVVGTLPFPKPVHVPIGMLHIELRKEGFFPSTRPVSIVANELTRESIDLQAMSDAPAAPTAPTARPAPAGGRPPGGSGRPPPGAPGPGLRPGPAPSVGPSPGRPEPRSPAPTIPGDRPEEPSGRSWRRPLAWGAGAGALVSVGAGIAELLVRSRKVSDANNLQCNVMDGTVNPVDPKNTPRCLDLANSASTAGVVGVVAFSVGGGLAIASGLLFATLPSRTTSGNIAFACAPDLAGVGLNCRLRF